MNSDFNPDFNLKLPLDFYLQKTDIVAKELLGKILVRKNNVEILAGRIVETEAYLSENDYASHSAVGKTKRNLPMFELGGILYVYKIYGVHHCINVVTEEMNTGAAVLIRALEPLAGIDIMQRNRGKNELNRICSGPGNLAKAFNFTLDDNKRSFLIEDLYIQNSALLKTEKINSSKRIGITKSADLPLRFFIADNKFISR